MAVKIRLARGGAKKRPFYRVVVVDARSPRGGRFLERVGTYNPLLEDDSQERVVLKTDRVEHWLSVGAQPTDRVASFIEVAGITLPKAISKKRQIKKAAQTNKPPKKEKKEQ